MVRPSGRRDVAVGRQRRAVDLERDERQPVAVEHQRRGGAGLRIGPQLQRRAHRRLRRMQRDVEIDGLDQPVGRAIILRRTGRASSVRIMSLSLASREWTRSMTR